MSGHGERRRLDWPGRHGDPRIDADRVREIRRLWREAGEHNGLGQWRPTPSGLAIFAPLIKRVTLGDPTAIIVELRPGQLPEDVTAAAPRIARTMGIAGLRVTPMFDALVKVELLGAPAAPRTVPPVAQPASPLPRSTTEPTGRRGPSRAWTSRFHLRRIQRPDQPS